MADLNAPKKNLAATISVTAIGGAIAGAFIGSGIEDILSNISLPEIIQPLVEYLSIATSALGGITLPTWATIQYFNRDKHPGMLVIETKPQETKQKQIVPSTNYEGVAHSLDALTEDITNKQLGEKFYQTILYNLRKSPLSDLAHTYQEKKDSFLASSLFIFSPFMYEGRLINPKEEIEAFFATSDELLNQMKQYISNKSAEVAANLVPPNSLEITPQQIRDTLEKDISKAVKIATWAAYLSDRGGIVGSQVREKLAIYGINQPKYLPQDVEKLGEKVLNIYDKLMETVPA